MLYILAVVLGLVLGLALKGSLRNFTNFNIRYKWIFISAFLIQLSYQILCAGIYSPLSDYSFYVQAFIFLLLYIGIWFNRHYLGAALTGIGSFLNVLVMMSNGGKMPVSANIINSVMLDENLKSTLLSDGRHVLAGESTRLALLMDNMYIPGFFGTGMRIVSIGDLVVVAGLFILVTELTAGRTFGFRIKRKNVQI